MLFSSSKYETQKYDLIFSEDEFEIRFYPSSLKAKVVSTRNANGNFYKLNYHDSKIYKTNKEGVFDYDTDHHPLNETPLDFSITKNVASIILVAILMFLLFTGLSKSFAKNKGISKGVGRFFEPIILYIRDEIAIPNIGEKKYKNYMSFLLT